MTETDDDELVRAAIKLQGDSRPFSTAVIRPQAIIKQGMVQPLLKPLRLERDVELVLVPGIAKVLRKYVGSKKTADDHASHAVSLRNLGQIAQVSQRLADLLTTIGYQFQHAIEQHRLEESDRVEARPFELQLLVPTLQRLGRSAARARSAISANRAGAPGYGALNETVAELMKLITAAGLPIRATEAGAVVSGSRRRLTGTGGALLQSIFRRFDPEVKPPALWTAVKNAQTNAPHQ